MIVLKCFGCFWLGYLALTVICRIIPRLNPILYWLTIGILHAFFALPIFKIVMVGKENIPKKGPFEVCGKHISYTDIPFLATIIPHQLHFLAKSGLLKFPLFGWWLYAVGSFPIHQNKPDRAAIDFAINILEQDKIIAIMPEGGRKTQEKVGELQGGAAMIALMSENIKILPIGIYYRCFYRWHLYQLSAYIGKTIETSEYKDLKDGRQILTAKILETLQDAQKNAKSI